MVSLSSLGDKSQRGGGQNVSFNISRDSVPKPALVPVSRLYCDIDKCSIEVCGKFHQD